MPTPPASPLRRPLAAALLALAAACKDPPGVDNRPTVTAFVRIEGTPADVVGGSGSVRLEPGHHFWEMRFVGPEGAPRGVEIFATSTPGTTWFLRLAAPEGGRLEPGATYANAVRSPAPHAPQLMVSRDPNDVCEAAGDFVVLALEVRDGRVWRLEVAFDARCVNGSGRMRGDLSYVLGAP